MRIHEKLEELKKEAQQTCAPSRETSIFLTEIEKLILWAEHRLVGDR